MEKNIGQTNADPSSSFGWYVLNTIMKSRDARSEKDIYKAFSYFEDALQPLLNFMELEEKRQMEKDLRQYYAMEKEIEDSGLPDATKQTNMNKLKLSFMRAHRAALFLSLSRTRIVTIQEDGEIDFTDIDFETTKKIIRASSLRQNIMQKEEENGKA